MSGNSGAKWDKAETISFSAAYFPIIAFLLGDNFKYGLCDPTVCNAMDTSKFASRIDEDGTCLQSEPFSSGNTIGVEDFAHFLKYSSNDILTQTATQKSWTLGYNQLSL